MFVSECINQALRSIGALASGEQPSSDETTDALNSLNVLIDNLSAEGLGIPAMTQQTYSLFGTGTVGTMARPIRLMAASIATNGFNIPVKVVTADEFAANQAVSAHPHLFCDYAFPTSTLSIKPSQGTGNLTVFYTVPLGKYFATTTDTNLPPGYDRALVLLLAQDLALQFTKPLDQGLAALAAGAKLAIEGLNKADLGSPVPAGQQG